MDHDPRPLLVFPVALGALVAIAFPTAAVLAQQDAARFTVVETGQTFDRLQLAVDAIGDSRGTIAIAPGRYADCAVQNAGHVSYMSAEPGAAVFDGRTCEGKAALVLRGRGAEVSGLVFQNMRVPDFNGAGIRLEQGDLTVAESWFRDSEQGILTGDDGRGRIVIDRSLEAIIAAGRGVVLYLRQEGRGIGLVNKLRAYRLQDQGFDTLEANRRLGLPAEARDFPVAARMLALLGVREVRLLTNNPAKVAALEAAGMHVAERVPHHLPAGPHNERYLATKRDQAGHLLD